MADSDAKADPGTEVVLFSIYPSGQRVVCRVSFEALAVRA